MASATYCSTSEKSWPIAMPRSYSPADKPRATTSLKQTTALGLPAPGENNRADFGNGRHLAGNPNDLAGIKSSRFHCLAKTIDPL